MLPASGGPRFCWEEASVLRSEKERIVSELAERLRASDMLIVADYRGLSMTEMDDLRTKLLEHGARFSVVKNTLTKRAAEEAGVPALVELIDGPSAIAFVGDGDMVAVARTLNETGRRTRVLEIRGAVMQGAALAAEQVRELATLPPAEVLRGQVLGAIIGPLNAIAGLVNAPLQDLVELLDARSEQLDSAAAAASAEEESATEAESAEETTEEPKEEE
jgi:large subunit ribosomal protein L10